MGSKSFQMQVNFNGGVVSPFFTCRVDMARYATSCCRMDNFIPRMYGSMRRRPGTRKAGVLPGASRLLRWQTSGVREFVVALHADVVVGGVMATIWRSDASLYSGEPFKLIRVDGIDGYSESELMEVTYVTQNDVMWLCQGNHPPLQLVHSINADGTDKFEAKEMWFKYPPKGSVSKRMSFNFSWDGVVPSKGSAIDVVATGAFGFDSYNFTSEDVGSVFYFDLSLIGSMVSSKGVSNRDQVSCYPVMGEWKVTTPKDVAVKKLEVRYVDLLDAKDFNCLDRDPSIVAGNYSVKAYEGVTENGKQWTVTGVADEWRLLCVYAGDGFKNDGVIVELEVKNSYHSMPFKFVGFDAGNHPVFKPMLSLGHLKPSDEAGSTLKYIPYLSYTKDGKILFYGVNLERGAFSKQTGFPRAVALRGGRLIFAGTKSQPQTIWGSVIDDYEDFTVGSKANDGWDLTIGANESQLIQWLNSGKDLIVGTDAGEWVLDDSDIVSADNPVPRIREQSRYGSKALQGITMSDSVFYVPRSGDALRQAIYDYGVDGYKSDDMTVIAGDVMEGGCVSHAIQKDPDAIWWGVTGEGNLAGLLYDRQNSINGWCRQVFPGAAVQDVVVFCDTRDGHEAVGLVVVRDGVHFFEVMDEGNPCVDSWDGVSDNGVAFDSVWEGLPMGGAQSPAVQAMTTQINSVFFESQAEGEVQGFATAVAYTNGVGSGVARPVTFRDGRGSVTLTGNSAKDCRLRFEAMGKEKLEVLAAYITYTSNLM